MIDFSTLSAQEKDLIIRLPYRVGVWVSESDDVGGEEADQQEIRTLQALLIAYVEDFCKTEFVQRVMEQTVAHRGEWDNWVTNIDTVPEECKQAIDYLSDKLEEKELLAFKNNLIEIGYSVAMAYREFDDEAGFGERFSTYLRLLIEKITSLLKGQEMRSTDESLNVSLAEQRAIDEIQQALFGGGKEQAVVEQ